MAVETAGVEIASLADRVAARAKARAEKRARTLTIPVPGYEDLFQVQYRRLGAEERIAIASRHGLDENSQVSVDVAADMLINACVDVLEVERAGELRSLGGRWSVDLISSLFDIEFPPETRVRGALRAALGGDDLLLHFAAWTEAVEELDSVDREELPGESVPSVEG